MHDPTGAAAPAPALPPDDPQRTLAHARPDAAGSLPHLALAGDTYTGLLTGADTAGRFTLIDMHVPPGGGPPPHRHDFEETFSLLDGEVAFTFACSRLRDGHWFVGTDVQQPISGAFRMAQRDAVFPAGRHDLYASQTYSAAIRSGDLLFVSGQVGSRSDGSPEPDFEAQVRLAFANLEATLQAGGCGLDDVVDVTTFHTDPENQFGTMMIVKSEVFPKAPYPNWTAIGVNWLGGFDFEIKVIARIPG